MLIDDLGRQHVGHVARVQADLGEPEQAERRHEEAAGHKARGPNRGKQPG